MQPEGGGGGKWRLDTIDWLMKHGGQIVLVEIVCSTKECNIRTQKNSMDSRLLMYFRMIKEKRKVSERQIS